MQTSAHRGKSFMMAEEGQPPRPPSRSSREFGDQIRQLEVEGSKLLSATSALQESLGAGSLSIHGVKPVSNVSHGLSTEKLTELTDITAEQRAIDTLKAQLDAQSMETERLSRTYLGDKGFRYASTGSLLERLDIPTSAGGDSLAGQGMSGRGYSSGNTGGLILPGKPPSGLDYLNLPQPSSAVEQELREARKEVSDLRCRLSEALRTSEKQREEFRMGTEELRRQLQDALLGRDNVLQMRHRENFGQETLIQRLQSTVDQLEQANKNQEKTLMEMNSRLETCQRDSYEVETGLNAVRGMLLEREHQRGKPFNPAASITRQDLKTLVASLHTCVSEMSKELESNEREISKLANEVEDKKLTARDREEQLTKEHTKKLMDVSALHEAAMNSFTEHSLNSKQQVTLLQEQISMLQQQTEHQVKMKQDVIEDLEVRIQSVKQQGSEDEEQWRDKREGLEKALDETNKELAMAKTERDTVIREMAAVESRHDDMQKTIENLTESLVVERGKLCKKTEEAAQMKVKLEAVTEAVEDKTRELADLHQALATQRQESQTQLHKAVNELQKEGYEKSEQKTSTLALQLNAMTDKCQRLSMDLELTKSHHNALTERHEELKVKHDRLQEEMIATSSTKEHASSLLKDRIQEVERLTQEKEGYLKLLEERNKELSRIQMIKEKLTVQLQEREHNFLALQHQYDKTCELSDISSKTLTDVRKERDELNQRINEKIIETEELRRARDSLNKKLRHRDRHINELETENQRLVVDSKHGQGRVELLVKEKEGVVGELKESRYEVANLQQEKASLVAKYEARATELTKELSRVKHHLKETERELKLAKKMMKSREGMDDKAIKVAGKMQKAVTEKRGEIDHLQSRIRWLEECVEALNKDKKSIEDESTQLAVSVQKTLHQNERLSAELKSYVTRNQELNNNIKSLKADLDKAHIKQATVQAKAEEYEQDLTRLKLKHQLELKEIERTGQLNRHNQLNQQPPLRNSPTPRPITVTSSNHKVVKSGRVKSVTPTSDLNIPVRDKPVKTRKAGLAVGRSSASAPRVRPSHKAPGSKQAVPRGGVKKASGFVSPVIDKPYRSASPDPSLTSVTSLNLTPEPYMADRDGRSSPVSDLLTGPYMYTGNYDSDPGLEVSDVEHSECYQPTTYSQNKGKGPLKSDTKELCQRLERKMELLTRMGGKLQKDNNDMAKIMKREDSKLKRIKTQMAR